jgi:hypothetical protein
VQTKQRLLHEPVRERPLRPPARLHGKWQRVSAEQRVLLRQLLPATLCRAADHLQPSELSGRFHRMLRQRPRLLPAPGQSVQRDQ